jgi:hypothetical protein
MARGPIPDFPRDRPTVSDVAPLIDRYWHMPGHEIGGNLHVVLDDGNIDDSSVEGSLETALARGDVEATEILTLLRQMTTTQRRRLIWKYM